MTEVSSVANTVLTTLDIGSGIDSQKLAEDLTNAIKIPQENRIQGQIDASEASISAYGLVKFQINQLKASFEKLNDVNELATSAGSSSDITKMTVSSVSGTAAAGAYDFKINQLAQNQRTHSDQYTSTTQALNSGASFNMSLSVGATKSAVSAVYSASATASETTTLVLGDGTNTVTVASASYTSVADQVSAIQASSGYGNLLFTVGLNSSSDGMVFTYKTAGSVASTPTFTGSGSNHTVTNSTVGVSVPTAVTGVAAKYTVTGNASETTDFVISDGITTVRVDEATYTSIAEQVTAIKAGIGYDNLKFTVSANDSNDGFVFDYKTTAAVGTAPTLTGTGSSHVVNNTITGVTPVNAATTTTISIAMDTPAGVVKAINESNAGVTATLVDIGTNKNAYKILLTGQSGSDKAFTITSAPDLGFNDVANALQLAQDSILEYEGMKLTRGSNILTDVINGATINLMDTSVSNVRLSITNDRSALKTGIQSMVSTYNDTVTLLNTVTAADSEAELAGSLTDDSSVVRFLKNKIRTNILADSSTPSGSINALRDIGVSINEYGVVTFSETEYDNAVASHYDDIVTMLTANTNDHNLFESSNKGLAQDIATLLGDFTDSDGIISLRETGSKAELSDHEDALIKLEQRMEVVYNRYLAQFGAMETLMATIDSTKDYLTAQFESLSKAYDTK